MTNHSVEFTTYDTKARSFFFFQPTTIYAAHIPSILILSNRPLPCGLPTALSCATCAASALDITRVQGLPISALEHCWSLFDQQEQLLKSLPGGDDLHDFLFTQPWRPATTQIHRRYQPHPIVGILNSIKANVNICARQPSYDSTSNSHALEAVK